mmetsp:Transcript_1148/g.2497  ORF Transcript_1148/g.2497 Transcript_1148/m.2497 type:complete len:331 (+) Transcript_1148:2-994(+)
MNTGPSGFQNAPVTKGLLALNIGATLLSSITHSRHLLDISSHTDVFRKHQLWRLFTHSMPFRSAAELIFGGILLYQFRLFERQMGSRKYGAFCFVTTALSTTLQLVLSVRGISNVAPGPYAIIFAGLVHFFYEVPVSHSFSVCGLKLSDKVLVYIFALQLMWSSYPSTAWAAGCGLISGALYSTDLLPIKRFQFPRWFTNAVRNFCLPLLQSPQQRLPRPNVPGATAGHRRHSDLQEGQGFRDTLLGPGAGGGYWDQQTMARQMQFAMQQQQIQAQHQATPPAPAPPSEENLQTLESMGFPRLMASEALTRCNNDISAAAEYLLGGGSPP